MVRHRDGRTRRTACQPETRRSTSQKGKVTSGGRDGERLTWRFGGVAAEGVPELRNTGEGETERKGGEGKKSLIINRKQTSKSKPPPQAKMSSFFGRQTLPIQLLPAGTNGATPAGKAWAAFRGPPGLPAPVHVPWLGGCCRS